ncbi:ORFL153W [Human betaherpesvirus 5]|nr:ORFL153W [Human betaherpesvirus 5]QHX40485.1 ORFL153W [Human betaherpesvirus 5]
MMTSSSNTTAQQRHIYQCPKTIFYPLKL